MHRSRVFATLIMVAGLIGGYGSTDTPVRASASATSAPSTSEGTATSGPSTLPTSAPTTAPSGDSDRAACITNSWTLLADQVQQLFAGTAMSRLPGFSMTASGEGAVSFLADGTYHYEPNFEIEITVSGQTGTAGWSGTLDGTWSVDGDQLTMVQTQNALSGSMTIMGTSMPMPANHVFSGVATVVDCQPATLTTRVDSPGGPIEQTLVDA
jgi:hypothetical protein